ncbi:sterol carrier protein domain-containing protein [Clostridium sp. HBUAS56010]|uniref:sterol carrier protein domain-containing protein n=1 Tax=Clostridium sp. HBUAS56010 TaxID=2571127 RepID=UPI001178A826|nr:sterol carrier protein domain-containing protein [Clostridium sp. HBUAS56010]
MHHPDDKGSYRLKVEDEFLPHNSGVYTVSYSNGKARSVLQTPMGDADMKVSIQTLCQMVLGSIDLNAAAYRFGSEIYSNQDTLKKVFVEKKIFNQ